MTQPFVSFTRNAARGNAQGLSLSERLEALDLPDDLTLKALDAGEFEALYDPRTALEDSMAAWVPSLDAEPFEPSLHGPVKILVRDGKPVYEIIAV